jgi:hypothetical protein
MSVYDENAWMSDCTDLAYQLRELLFDLLDQDMITDEGYREKVLFALHEAEIILDK